MLRLDPGVREEVVDHAREGAPAEVCGVLGGRYDASASTATTARRAENVAATPRTRYELDPAEQLRLLDEIEEAGDDVVGFYHSHPAGPADPSETDAAQATWEGYSYVIVDLSGEPVVGSWRWTGETFEREETVVE
jgi:proteasome lid subunit RPN8/RPN11